MNLFRIYSWQLTPLIAQYLAFDNKINNKSMAKTKQNYQFPQANVSRSSKPYVIKIQNISLTKFKYFLPVEIC